MEIALGIIKVAYLIAYLILGIWWWVSWVGMHNNTIDGNTYRLIYPFIIFDKKQFNEKGNSWRRSHLTCDVIMFVFGLIYFGYNW